MRAYGSGTRRQGAALGAAFQEELLTPAARQDPQAALGPQSPEMMVKWGWHQSRALCTGLPCFSKVFFMPLGFAMKELH